MTKQAVRNGMIIAVAALVAGAVAAGYWVRMRRSTDDARPVQATTTRAASTLPKGLDPVHQNAPGPAKPLVTAQNVFEGAYSQEKYLLLKANYKRRNLSADGPLTGRVLDGELRVLASSLEDGKVPPTARAIYEGNVETVEEKLGAGLSPDTLIYVSQGPVDYNATLLNLAIDAGQRNVIKLLLEHGASPNPLKHKFPDGTSVHFEAPLPQAALLGEDDVVELLLQYGADINQTSSIPGLEDSALDEAVGRTNVSTAYLLLMHGANIQSALGPGGELPARYARSTYVPNELAMRQLLLAHGATMPPSPGTPSP